MRLPRFYYSELKIGSVLINEKKNIHHLIKVLRSKTGDQIELFDGKLSTGLGEIKEISKDSIKVDITKIFNQHQGYTYNYDLVVPVLKKDSLFLVIHQSVEIGINNIFLYRPDRIDQSMLKKDISKIMSKLEDIVIAACAQSGNNKLSKIQYSKSLDKALKDCKYPRVIFDNQTENSICNMKGGIYTNGVTLVIGCESGFSMNERSLFVKDEIFKLRTNILRAETAPIVALTTLKTKLEDI